MPSSTRVYYLDLAKVLATFLVVYAHLFTGDSNTDLYLYAFHLPCFYLISGVFHRHNGHVQWKKYAISLLWPTLIFFIITLIFSTIHGLILSSSFAEGVDFAKATVYGLVYGKGVGVYWFLIALFWCKVLTDFFLRAKKKWGFIIAWALFLIVPWALRFHLPLLISNALMAMPFYLAGYYGRNHLNNRTVSYYYLIPALICLVTTILLSLWNGKVSMVGVHFGNLPRGGSIPVFYLNGFIGSALILSLSLLPLPQIKSCSSLSKALITVVGLQGIFITVYSDLFGRNNSFIFSFVASCVIIGLCWLSHFWLNRLYHR